MKTRIALLLIASAIAVANGADAPAPPSKDAIKEAAAYILSCDCGNSRAHPVYVENAKLLKDAGVAVVPVLVELLADDELSTSFVSSAAFLASTFPFSQPFCDVLRHRRDDKRFDHDPGAMLGVYVYFAQVGDRTDLEWMERTLSRLDGYWRTYAEASVQKLRERLSRK